MPPLDDIDRMLIDALRKDGRTPNKALAAQLGVSEATVASRLRQLHDDNVMRVILRRDLYSKGYALQCFADVCVAGRQVREVADDLARIGAVTSVSLLLGTPEILVVFNARDRHDLMRVQNEELAAVQGVARIEIHVALDIRKYKAGYARLGSS